MKLSDFKNKHANESILVCGLGESLALFSPRQGVTIGVNDIGRLFQPTYLLNVNNKSQYKGDRFSYIENSQAQALFTHRPQEQGNCKIPIVTFELDKRVGAVDIIDDKLPHYRNSPYMAVQLAVYMGASRIGLIGVDFTDNHFWIKDGPHRLMREFDAINKQYTKLWAWLRASKIELLNLSSVSRLEGIPKISLETWQA